VKRAPLLKTGAAIFNRMAFLLRFSKSSLGSDHGDSDLDEPAKLSFRFYLFIAWRFLRVVQAVSLKDAKPEDHYSTYPIFVLP